jgi:hypothetical protein
MRMNRFQAAATHLALSVAIATAIFLPVYFFWYPSALFDTAGGRDLFLLIAGVDVVLGPLLTLVVFRGGKKGLAFDLAIIAAMQAIALSYGVWVLFESRPAYIVFVRDRFELVRANDFPPENLEKAARLGLSYASLSWTGPPIVAALIPTDPAEFMRIAISGAYGIDIQRFPEHYVPYARQQQEALAKGQPLKRLRELNPGAADHIDRMLARLGRRDAEVLFLPLRAGKQDLSVLMDAKSGEVLRYESLLPWEYK